MNKNFREIADADNEEVVSHELFHQWFGDYATAKSWSHLTVNESFANYGEQLWLNHKYPGSRGAALAIDDLNKYLKASNNSDPALVRFHYDNKEDMFDHVSYNKGGAILHYIHTILGETKFRLAMKLYLEENALKPAGANDWQKAVEIASGREWSQFFEEWYYRGGHPDSAYLSLSGRCC